MLEPVRVRLLLCEERVSLAKQASMMFFFFSNTLGCAASILISLIATVVLLALFGGISL